MSEYPEKFVPRANMPEQVTLNFDDPIEKEGKYGTFYVWGLTHNGVKKNFNVSPKLYEQMRDYGEGDNLIITKEEIGDGKYNMIVEIQGGIAPQTKTPKKEYVKPDYDTKSVEIQAQSNLRSAVMLFKPKDKWTEDELDEVFEVARKMDEHILLTIELAKHSDKEEPKDEKQEDLPF